MVQLYKPQTPKLQAYQDLTTLVENRTVYDLENFELNIFETN